MDHHPDDLKLHVYDRIAASLIRSRDAYPVSCRPTGVYTHETVEDACEKLRFYGIEVQTHAVGDAVAKTFRALELI